MNKLPKAWAIAEGAHKAPNRLNTVVPIAYDDFQRSVRRAEAGNTAEAAAMVASLYAGDLWIIKGAFSAQFMRELREKTIAWTREKEPSFHKMLEGSPDFHRIIDLETGKKYSFKGCKHSAYFYRWNDDPLGIWPEITERWRIAKLAMGLEADAYENFTPKDGVVDRIQVVRYPPAIGYLEPHADPYLHQRCFFSVYMSKRGVDFDGGGFYVVDHANRAVEMEDMIDVGDAALGYATVVHGVAPCDRHKTPSWDGYDGRWFLSLYSNASDEVPQRHTGHPEKVDVAGVLP